MNRQAGILTYLKMSTQEAPLWTEDLNYLWGQELFDQEFFQYTEGSAGPRVKADGTLDQHIVDQGAMGLDIRDTLLQQNLPNVMIIDGIGSNPETGQNTVNLERCDAFDVNDILTSGFVDQCTLGQSMMTQPEIDDTLNLDLSISNANTLLLTASDSPLIPAASELRNTQDSASKRPNKKSKGVKISSKEWEKYKKTIYQIWIVEKQTMPTLIEIMTRDYKFPAT